MNNPVILWLNHEQVFFLDNPVILWLNREQVFFKDNSVIVWHKHELVFFMDNSIIMGLNHDYIFFMYNAIIAGFNPEQTSLRTNLSQLYTASQLYTTLNRASLQTNLLQMCSALITSSLQTFILLEVLHSKQFLFRDIYITTSAKLSGVLELSPTVDDSALSYESTGYKETWSENNILLDLTI